MSTIRERFGGLRTPTEEQTTAGVLDLSHKLYCLEHRLATLQQFHLGEGKGEGKAWGGGMAESTLGRQRCSLGNCFVDTCHSQAHRERVLSSSQCGPLAVGKLISASCGWASCLILLEIVFDSGLSR